MTPSSPLRNVSSNRFRRSAVNLGSTIESDFRVCSRSPVFTTWLSTDMNLRSHQTVTSMLLIRQGLECVDEIVTYSMWWSLCSEDRAILCDQDSVRVPPVVLAATRSAPRVALLIIFATFRVARLTLPTEKTLVGGCRARNASVTLACVSFHLFSFFFWYKLWIFGTLPNSQCSCGCAVRCSVSSVTTVSTRLVIQHDAFMPMDFSLTLPTAWATHSCVSSD